MFWSECNTEVQDKEEFTQCGGFSFSALPWKLHPGYKGDSVAFDLQERARNWLKQEKPVFLQYVLAFSAESKPFPQTFFERKCMELDPLTWWEGVRKSKTVIDSLFFDFVALLLKCPASSASIERIFSSFGYIWNRLRNRLGLQKAAKLVFCFRMLNRTGYDPEW